MHQRRPDRSPPTWCVVGVGADPRTELAEAAGLPVDNGIVVDEHLRTSRTPDVYAAGDVAAAWHPRYRTPPARRALGQRPQPGPRRGPQHARRRHPPTTRLPYFFSDQYDLGMEYVGRRPGGLRPGGGPRRPDRPGVHRLLARRTSGSLAGMNVNVWDVIESIQALIRERPAGRPGAARRPRHPPGPGDQRAGDNEHPMTKLHQLHDRYDQSPG